MNSASAKPKISQLPMPGIPVRPEHGPTVALTALSPGREVVYHGNINGGPRHGAKGIVRQALGRRVVVDMGTSGVWHIPYYFLSITGSVAA